MKKVLLYILVFFNLLTLLSACGTVVNTPPEPTKPPVQQNSPGGDSASALDATNDTLEKYGIYVPTINGVPQFAEQGPDKLTDKPVTLRVFVDMNENTVPPDEVFFTRWLEDKTNVHIEWDCPATSEVQTKLTLNLTSGDYADLYLAIPLTSAQVLSYASQGILASLSPYLEKYGPNYKKLLDTDPEAQAVITAPDGEVYTWDRMNGALHPLTPNKLYVNKPWIEKLNISVPSTLAEFENYLKAVRDNDLNGNGDTKDEIPFYAQGWKTVAGLIMPFEPVTMTSPNMLLIDDGKCYAPFATEKWKEGLAWIKGLYDQGLIPRDAFQASAEQVKELVSRPDALIVGAAGGWFNGDIGAFNKFPDMKITDYYVATGPLADANGHRQAAGGPNNTKNSFMSSTCAYPEIAVSWMDYWYTQEGAIVSYVGMEGFTWEWSDEPSINGKTPSLKKSPTYPDNFMWGANQPRLATFDIRYLQHKDEKAIEYQIYLGGSAYIDYVPDELVDTLWVNEEAAQIISQFEAPVNEYAKMMAVAFILGDKDLNADWSTYLKELENMGLSQYVNAYQESYNSTN